jgi:micrococcal nuclease
VLGVIARGREDVGGPAGIAPTPTLAVALPGLNPDQQRLQPAEVVRVIDGDTIDVRLAGDVERIRYFGIDTPERGDRCFREATERNEALVGERVLLLPDARERDQFGRLLRYVFDDQGRSIDARLIAEGLAKAWRPDGAYRDELVELEEEIRAAGVGCLW